MGEQWRGGEEKEEERKNRRERREEKDKKEGQMTKADADEMHWLFWASQVSIGGV
jgi:hypothetical protein